MCYAPAKSIKESFRRCRHHVLMCFLYNLSFSLGVRLSFIHFSPLAKKALARASVISRTAIHHIRSLIYALSLSLLGYRVCERVYIEARNAAQARDAIDSRDSFPVWRKVSPQEYVCIRVSEDIYTCVYLCVGRGVARDVRAFL